MLPTQTGTCLYYYGYTSGKLTSFADPASEQQTTYAYNGSGLLQTVTNPLGNQWTIAYDSQNRVSSITRGLDRFATPTATASSSGGSLATGTYYFEVSAIAGSEEVQLSNEKSKAVTGPNGKVTVTWTAIPGAASYRVYRGTSSGGENKYHTVTSGTSYVDTGGGTTGSPPQSQTSFTYTLSDLGFLCSLGMETDVTDPNNNTTKYCTDGRARVYQTVDPLSGNRASQFDAAAGGGSCVDSGGETFDDMPCATSDAGGYFTKYWYDATGEKLEYERSPTQTSSHQSGWTYTDTNNPYAPSTFTDANGNTTNYSYDTNGNLATSENPLTNLTTYCYNSLGELAYEYKPIAGSVTCGAAAPGETSYTYATSNTSTATIGDLVSKTDPLGNQTTYTYDAAGNQTSSVEPLGNVSGGTPSNYTVSSNYDADGRTLSRTNELGYTTTYTFDAAGNHLTTSDANAHVTSDCYGVANQVLAEYDAFAGSVSCASPPSSHVTYFNYDPAGNQVTTTDQLGNTTTDCYDAKNELTAEFSPLAGTPSSCTASTYKTSYTYDAAGNKLTETSTLSISPSQTSTTTYTYYDDSSLESVMDDLANVTTYGYDWVGNEVSVTDAEGHTAQSIFDADNQVTCSQSGLSTGSGSGVPTVCGVGSDSSKPFYCPSTDRCGTTIYTYDADGNVHTILSPDNQPSGTPTTDCYDANDELISEFGPLSTVTAPCLAALLGLAGTASSTGGSLSTGTYYYEVTAISSAGESAASSEISKAVTGPTGSVALSWTAVTGATSYRVYRGTSSGGENTYYTSSSAAFTDTGATGTSGSPPLAYATSHTYDANGNNISKQTAMGTTTNGYDHAGQLTSIAYANATGNTNPATPNVSYTYDPVGNRLTMSDGGSGTVNYAYDALDNLCSVYRGGTPNCATWSSGMFNYGYDAASDITSQKYPDGTSVTNTYDADSNLASVASGGATTSYGYYQNDSLKTTTLPTTSSTYIETRTYDDAVRLQEIKTTDGTTTQADVTYTLNGVGSPTTVARTGNASCTVTNGYDSNERLNSASYGSGCPGNSTHALSFDYTYDADGNWANVAQTPSGGPTTTKYYPTNAADQLCLVTTSSSATCSSANITYDTNGNQTYDPNNSHTYTYDLENRATCIDGTGSSCTGGTSSSYDGDGNLLSTTTGAATTNYTWDTNTADGIPADVRETSSGALLNRYVYGNDRVSWTDSGSNTHYYVYDGLGSVLNTLSSAGATEWAYTYEPYGGMRLATATGSPPTNVMQFTSDPVNTAASNLYNSATRAYDATTGRFLSQDPDSSPAETAGTYVYGNDSPHTYVDPSGATPVEPLSNAPSGMAVAQARDSSSPPKGWHAARGSRTFAGSGFSNWHWITAQLHSPPCYRRSCPWVTWGVLLQDWGFLAWSGSISFGTPAVAGASKPFTVWDKKFIYSDSVVEGATNRKTNVQADISGDPGEKWPLHVTVWSFYKGKITGGE